MKMVVRAIVEIITEIDIHPDDPINSDTIGDYKAELDCCVGNTVLQLLSEKLKHTQADIKIEACEPYDTGIEDYGKILNNWQRQYNESMERFLKKLDNWDERKRIQKDLGT